MTFQKPSYKFLQELIELRNKFDSWNNWSFSIDYDKGEVQKELEDLLSRLNSLYDLLPLVRFELSSANSPAISNSFYHETEVIFDSISYPFLNEWEIESDKDLHQLFLSNTRVFDSLLAILYSDSGWGRFLQSLPPKLESTKPEEESEENPNIRLGRKSMYLLLHYFGFFEAIEEKLDSPSDRLKAKLVRSFSPSKNKFEGVYTNHSAMLPSGQLMKEQTIKDILILSLELDVPELKIWAEDLLEKID